MSDAKLLCDFLQVASDAALYHAQARVVVHLDDDLILLVADREDRAVDARGGEDLVVLLQGGEQHLPLLFLPPHRADHQEVEERDD